MLKTILFSALFLGSSCAMAQVACSVSGPAGYNGPPTSSLNVTCGSTPAPAPAPTPPPPPPPPPSSCDATQLSSSINGHYLRRQCSVSMTVWPSGQSYGGPATDLGTVLGGSSWPRYNYSGYSPTYTVSSGYYISLAFTVTSPGAFQMSANPSYGDGGTISLSKTPGLMSTASGAICALARGGANGIYISTAAGVCTVTQGGTYYLNMADVDTFGNNLCHNGRPGTCADSPISYTIYTSQ